MQHSTEAFYEEKHLLLIGKGNRLNYGGLSVYHGEMFTSWNIYCIVSLMTTIEAMKLSQICPMNFIIWVWNLDVVFHLAPPLCLPIFYYLVSNFIKVMEKYTTQVFRKYTWDTQYFLSVLKKYKMKFMILIMFLFYHIEFIYLEVFFGFP